jgi:hypothetical protein
MGIFSNGNINVETMRVMRRVYVAIKSIVGHSA